MSLFSEAGSVSKFFQSSRPPAGKRTAQEIVNRSLLKGHELSRLPRLLELSGGRTEGRLHLNAFSGIPEKAAREIEWLDFGAAVCGCAAGDGERIVCENILDTADPRTEQMKSFGIRAFACYPLFSRARSSAPFLRTVPGRALLMRTSLL